MEETILSKLRDEHRELQVMLLKVERCKDPGRKLETYEDFKRVLIPHMEGEEETLYKGLRDEVNEDNAAELADDAKYEHQEIKEMLAMLDELEIDKEDWNDLFSDLKESLQLHIEEEETLIFGEAKADFSRDDLVRFASEFEEAKTHASLH